MYYGNQIQNPYAGYPQAFNQFPPQTPIQMPQYPQMKPGINGRIIHSIDEVNPNEVPSDGTYAIFVQDDNSCIYVQSWNTNGTINTIKFVPEQDTNKLILNKLNAIETMLNNRNNHRNNQKAGDNNG